MAGSGFSDYVPEEKFLGPPSPKNLATPLDWTQLEMWKLGLDPVPNTSRNLCFPFDPVETLSIQKKLYPVQHENGFTR